MLRGSNTPALKRTAPPQSAMASHRARTQMQGTPVVNARYIVAMQDISVEFPGDPYDLVNSAVAIAVLYLPLLGHPSGPDPHTVASASSTPDATQLRQLLAHAAGEFDKGKQIEAACSAAADFIPDPTIPNAHLAEFLGSGSNLDVMILRHQQAHEANRFNSSVRRSDI